MSLVPFNFKEWIDNHREDLKPPVANKMIFESATFIIMVVGGPNSRKDYHTNETEEFFYQLEGDISLKIINKGKFEEIQIKEGEIFLLPAHIPHSPQRSKNSVGLVVEKRRTGKEIDSLSWYCDNCRELLYLERFSLKNIETDLNKAFGKYYSDPIHYTCQKCGTICNEK